MIYHNVPLQIVVMSSQNSYSTLHPVECFFMAVRTSMVSRGQLQNTMASASTNSIMLILNLESSLENGTISLKLCEKQKL